ncbi:MAG: hypothetical protein ABI763_03295, partial [Bacteroidota bacterium]
MKQQITKLFLVFLIGIMTMADVFGQCPITVVTNNGSTSGNGRAPNSRFRSGKGVYIISAAELAAAGLAPGVLTGIEWLNQVAPGLAATGTLALYLENSSNTFNSKSTNFATAITGMSQVYGAAYTIPNTLAYGVTFSGFPTFTYTGGAIYVAWDWAYCSGTLSAAQVIFCNTALVGGFNSLLSGQTAVTCTTAITLASSAFRAHTSFAILSPANDAAVSNLYTLGTLALGYSTNHVVTAKITNVGTNPLVNYPCTLSITGANTFSDIQLVNIPSCGSGIVTFSPFTPTAIGSNTVAVSVASDDNNLNNSLSIVQTISAASIGYKYPGANTNGVGFNPPAFGDFIAKFQYAGNFGDADTIGDIKTDFTTTGIDYQIVVFNSDGIGGVPGTLLYNSATLQTAGIGSFFDNPDIIVTQDYYIGIRQLSSALANVGFAYQTENPVRTGAFYFTPSSIPPWVPFEPNNSFRLSIEVKLYQPLPPECAISMVPVSGGNVCSTTPTLTWASGGGGPIGYKITLGDNAPNYDNIANNLDLGLVTSYTPPALTQGNTYGWKINPYNAVGDASCSSQLFTVLGTPNGDNQALAITLSLPATVSGNNLSSNCFTDVYTIANTNGNASPDVYYKIHTGACTDALTISLCASAGTMDTYVHLLDEFGAEVAGDDDGCGGVGVPSLINQQAVNPDKDYYIVVEGFDVTQVTYSMSVSEFDLIPQVTSPAVTTVGPLCESGTLDIDAGTSPAGSYSYAWTTPDGFAPGNVVSFQRTSINPSMSGSYSVIVTSASGCISSGNVSATINNRPTASPTADPAFCAG